MAGRGREGQDPLPAVDTRDAERRGGMKKTANRRSLALRGNKNSQAGPEPASNFVYWRSRLSEARFYAKAARRAKTTESDWMRAVLNEAAGFKAKEK